MARSGVGNAGNVKMRGRRKSHTFACGCCWCIDDRDQLRTKAELKDARAALADFEAKSNRGGKAVPEWEFLEQCWLSGQMTPGQLRQHTADDPEFKAWFDSRVEERFAPADGTSP